MAFVPQDEANASPWGQMLIFGDNMPQLGTFCLELGTYANFGDILLQIGDFANFRGHFASNRGKFVSNRGISDVNFSMEMVSLG